MRVHERPGLKATSVIIAVLLWLIVKGRQPVQDYVPVSVMPTLDSSLVLLETPSRVRALVSGRAVDIVKLHVDPPVIHRLIDGDVPDTLVLDVTPADVRVPPTSPIRFACSTCSRAASRCGSARRRRSACP